MEAFLVVGFCAVLIFIMRGCLPTFGPFFATLIGVSFLGWIVVGVLVIFFFVVAPFVLPVLVPLAMICLVIWLLRRAC